MINYDIRIRGVTRSFAQKVVIDNINLEIPASEKVLISGANGAGKSTFLRLLATVLSPTAGTITIGPHSVDRELEKVRRHITWVPCSDRGFVSRFNGLDNLKFYCALCKVDKALLNKRLESLKGLKPLTESLSIPYYLCSSGMKQSLQLARACVVCSNILVLDEPFKNLDAESKNFAYKHLTNLKNVTVVLSSHDPDMLNQKGFQHLYLSNGRFE